MNSTILSFPQPQPDFILALAAERDLELRSAINKMVRTHSCNSSTPHRDVWRELYARLEKATSHPLPESDRLDHIQANGLLGDSTAWQRRW